jgi:hypothetical protein
MPVAFLAPAPVDVAFILGIVFLLVVPRFARRSGATLVLQKFSVHQKAQPFGVPIVEIVGRSEGLIAFLLTTMGFSASTKLTVTDSEVRCESASLFGQRFQFIPLRCVGTLAAGLHKPLSYLLVSVILVLFGLCCSFLQGGAAIFAVAIVVAAILVAVYFFSKKFFIEVYPNGGPGISLLFKPSAIEGIPIDVQQALAVIEVIRDVVVGAGRTNPVAQQPSPPPLKAR